MTAPELEVEDLGNISIILLVAFETVEVVLNPAVVVVATGRLGKSKE